MSSLATDYSKKNDLEKLLFSESDKEYEDNLEKLRVKQNETNENEETGIGNKTDNIEEKDLKLWNLIENINIKGQSDKDSYLYVIPDTREGWVESVKLLLESYFVGGRSFVFDY